MGAHHGSVLVQHWHSGDYGGRLHHCAAYLRQQCRGQDASAFVEPDCNSPATGLLHSLGQLCVHLVAGPRYRLLKCCHSNTTTHQRTEHTQCAKSHNVPTSSHRATGRLQPTDHNRLQRLQILPQMRHRKLQPPMPSWSNELILDENRPVLAHPAAASARTICNITHLRGIWRILGHSREKQPLCTSNAVQRWSAYGIVEGEQRIGNTGRHVVRGNDIRASTLCGLPHVVANKLHHIWISFRLASGFQRVFLADGLTGIHNRLQKYILDIRQRHII